MSELTIKDKVETILDTCIFTALNAEMHSTATSVSTEQIIQLIDSAITEAQIRGIEEAHKEILEMAYSYTGEDELSDFCGVDDLSRVAMSWKVDRIKELKNNTTKQEDIKDV